MQSATTDLAEFDRYSAAADIIAVLNLQVIYLTALAAPQMTIWRQRGWAATWQI
jgi:hypothetical protein